MREVRYFRIKSLPRACIFSDEILMESFKNLPKQIGLVKNK